MTEVWNGLLVHPLINLLMGAYALIADFGFAVVMATLVIRLVFYPLFVTQIRSQRAMQEVAPALNELRAKYGKDRQRMAEEQMKLYRERGVNPAMGCLPLLLQMPILFAFYWAVIQLSCGLGSDLGHCETSLTGAQFETIRYLFIPNPLGPSESVDLTARWLPWLSNGLGHPDPLFILPLLAGATQLIASVMAQPAKLPTNLDSQAKMMQSMTYYFPIITVVIAASFPSGLALYWIATTVFQIVQQYFVTGWGRLPRWVPFLRDVPTPADRSLARLQQAAVAEVESDMGETKAEAPAESEEAARRSRRRRRRGR